jgi:hypothetical protein
LTFIQDFDGAVYVAFIGDTTTITFQALALPYSAGRKPNVQDDNEFILLRVPELLRAH